jgi:hypothetical protein
MEKMIKRQLSKGFKLATSLNSCHRRIIIKGNAKKTPP